MYRYFIELAYDGTPFCGWQIQPDSPSVQESLNRGGSLILRESVEFVGAGRTDTGVHASFYVAHFDMEHPLSDCEELVRKLNSILPKEIAIFKIYPVPESMHARFSAISRTYRYRLAKGKNPFRERYTYSIHPLPDIEAMNSAAKILFEYSDFTSFSKLHTDVKTNNCKIMEAHWEESEEELIFTIKADRFLRNMVRAIVGTLIDVGQGKMSEEEFRAIIEAKDRCMAGTSVPGNALFLCDIEYPKI